MEDALRVDLLLHRLCLTRSRSEAKAACDAGAVSVDGQRAKASQTVSARERVGLRFTHRELEIEVLELPGKSVSKKTARELYRVLRDEPVSLP
jgi:ribosome-associated heat shock protein Hsp15